MTGLLLPLILAHALDAGTTYAALRHGGQESNPILTQQAVVNVSFQAAFTTAQVTALVRLHRTHPKWANTFAVVAIGVESAIVAHNARR